MDSGIESRIDSPSFFLAPGGKNNPAAEGEATLEAFFRPSVVVDPDLQHPQCAYAARYHWLKHELKFDPDRMPAQQCLRLENWLSLVNPSGVTLVFAESYLNNPASMFGHTLLRIDSAANAPGTRLLDTSVGFAAETGEEYGFSYAFKGLFGGYQGRFTAGNYYEQVREYGDIENRDIWEYRLDLSVEETRFLLLHVWELQNAYFDYYFFDENCSSQLLALLEVARPALELMDGFSCWVLPADTLRQVVQPEGVLRDVYYRPSRRKVMEEREQSLSTSNVQTAIKLTDGRLSVNDEQVEALTPVESAQVFELAAGYLLYKQVAETGSEDSTDVNLMHILLARSQLDVESSSLELPVPEVRPDQGHGSFRLHVGAGMEDGSLFCQAGFRPVLHDLFDPPGGYTQGAQIQFSATKFRYYPDQERFTLESIDLIDIFSAPHWSRLTLPVAWQANISAKRFRFDDNQRKLIPCASVGFGLSSVVSPGLFSYAFFKTTLLVSDRFTDLTNLGIGPDLGLIFQANDIWTTGLKISGQGYVIDEMKFSYDISLTQSVKLPNNSALRFELGQGQDFSDPAWRFGISLMFYL
ncbi:MAG: DUF4105 domain-containing protein [Desulfobulbaceae bacterium]|nr:DUF4105 domain-containing protein [Desulfobulbaceae bacterium]